MCCLAEFLVKYVLIIANIVFAIAGLAILGLGVAVHIQVKEIQELLPVALNALSVAIIVLGCIVFVIAFCACCGAIRESRCMLIFYAVIMGILASIKIYLTVVIFNFLGNVLSTVDNWLVTSFNNDNLRDVYHVLENLFNCCGTTGASSYPALGLQIPSSCCSTSELQCDLQNSYGGCSTTVSNYFETFGEAIGSVLIVVIIMELVCVLFGVFLSCQIRQKRYSV